MEEDGVGVGEGEGAGTGGRAWLQKGYVFFPSGLSLGGLGVVKEGGDWFSRNGGPEAWENEYTLFRLR